MNKKSKKTLGKKQKHIRKNKSKKSKQNKSQKGGLVLSLTQLYGTDLSAGGPEWIVNPHTQLVCNTLVKTIMPNYLYGTSLPIDNARLSMRSVLAFYMYRKEINMIIDLHACGLGTPLYAPSNCPTPLNKEELIWYDLKSKTPENKDNPNIQFHNYPIPDMTAGCLRVWNKISAYRFDKPENKGIVHCLAGYGRTGCYLLFQTLLYRIDKSMLGTPFLSSLITNSFDFYSKLVQTMKDNLIVDDDPVVNDIYNSRITAFSKNRLLQELFSINTLFKANLLIARINLILLFIADNKTEMLDGDPIVLYRLHNHITPVDYNNLFQPEQCIFYHGVNIIAFGLLPNNLGLRI
jgi:hypothetical protein